MLKTRAYWAEKLTEMKHMLSPWLTGDDLTILKEAVIAVENDFLLPAKEYISEYAKLHEELEKRGVTKGSTLYTIQGTLCSSITPIAVEYKHISPDHDLDTLFTTKEEAEDAIRRMFSALKKEKGSDNVS